MKMINQHEKLNAGYFNEINKFYGFNYRLVSLLKDCWFLTLHFKFDRISLGTEDRIRQWN